MDEQKKLSQENKVSVEVAGNSSEESSRNMVKQEETQVTAAGSSAEAGKSTVTEDELPDEIILELEGEKPYRQAWEAEEHIQIGDDAFNMFLDKLAPSDKDNVIKLLQLTPYTHPITKAKQLIMPIHDQAQPGTAASIRLSPGQIVALAGDYFGAADEPICFGDEPTPSSDSSNTKEARFLRAFDTLSKPEYQEQIARVLAYISDQTCGCANKKGTITYKKKHGAIRSTYECSIMTSNSKLPGAFWEGRYAGLLLKNFDHFYTEAKEAFLAGHLVALKNAKKGYEAQTETEKCHYFHLAILQALYACHFLTDGFAGGHIRTQRKQILNAVTHNSDGLDATPDLSKVSTTKLIIAGLFANTMHDEDNKIGIYVESKSTGERWLAYGDNMFHKKENEKNKERVCDAMLQVLLDIFNEFKNGYEINKEQIKSRYLGIIPTDVPELNCDATQRSPLFKISEEDKNTLLHREKSGKYKPMKTAGTLFECLKVKVSKAGEIPAPMSVEEAEKLIADLDESDIGCRIC